MSDSAATDRRPWAWVPTLYFAQGIPYVVVMSVAVVLYKRLGISNTDIALYTSWLYLPWVIKPLWSPFVDLLRTKRSWILLTQLLIGAGLAGVALTLPASDAFRWSLALFWLMAFSSATHDIAADGFYMLALNENRQAYFVGIRSTFYRLSMIFGQGLLIMLAGFLETSTGLDPVQLEVRAATQAAAELPALPDADAAFEATAGDLRLIAEDAAVEIALEQPDPAAAHALRQAVVRWNAEHGFTPPLASDATAGDPPARAGNLGLARLHLSSAPPDGEQVVVHLDRDAGDQSISLVEGARLTFTADNWNQPALLAFQLDHRLDEATGATFEGRAGNITLAWSITFLILGGLFLAICIYHRFVLPKPASDGPGLRDGNADFLREFGRTFVLFFRRPRIVMILAFLLLYRLGEAQLVKLASPFLLDSRDVGGLGLTTGEVGFVYGTVGVVCLTLGGILGGLAASRYGLKRCLMWMVAAINLPNAVYIYLSFAQPDSFWVVNLCVGIEQFGYGLGFTAYMLFMIYVSRGDHKTAHYAICTGLMALGMMLPGMVSGWLQEQLGYQDFFVWVLVATIPGFVIAAFTRIDAGFGKNAG